MLTLVINGANDSSKSTKTLRHQLCAGERSFVFRKASESAGAVIAGNARLQYKGTEARQWRVPQASIVWQADSDIMVKRLSGQ